MNAKTYTPSLPLIFVHIPKSGGSSVREVFGTWFGSNLYPHYFKPKDQSMPPRRDFLGLQRNQEPAVIYGHFNKHRGFGVEQYYPEASQFMTILRDPLEMHVSRFFYAARIEKKGRKIYNAPKSASLEDFVKTSHLSMLEHFPRQVTMSNYRDIIEEYFLHIGFLDHLEESLNHMGRILKKPSVDTKIPHLNVSARTQPVSEEAAHLFRENHDLEYCVYSHARDLFLPRQIQKRLSLE
ncbi:hypothetical protein [Shimia sp. MIT1388]|uniref:hypothetical protein n=1 Tax=Shimia sp. MIT1388 TaxID=3096992 RepID=UPI00399B2F0C